MKIFFYTLISILVCVGVSAHAATITNPGFEDGWRGWTEIDKDGKSTAISGDARSGDKSAKITRPGGSFVQVLEVKPNTNYQLSAYIMGTGIIGAKVGGQLFFERQGKTKSWQQLQVKFNSGAATKIGVFAQFNGKKSLFDDFAIEEQSGKPVQASSTVSLGVGGLSPDLPPGRNFELIDWYLSTPADTNGDGICDNIYERELAAGYQHKNYFYTAKDGGMVFKATVAGAKTSKNTNYVRTELREMLRRGDKSITTTGKKKTVNKNNWVFSTAPGWSQKAAGGIDGTLIATLAVNHVTTTGKQYQIGRVIIGQIHAKDAEPVRLYYRKLPGHKKGSIYAAHETAAGDTSWIEILGSRSDSAQEPQHGIALNKKFTYVIVAKGNQLAVAISQEGKILGQAKIDMTKSGYDISGEYMYFKAGAYNQNNSGNPDDYVQVTFYQLENTHEGYDN